MTTIPPSIPGPTLILTHTDRDGIFSGAAMLRALGDPEGPDVVLTQGSYLAEELEALAADGRVYRHVYACDTYWHAPHARRIVAGLRAVLEPEGTIAWLDHHPGSVEAEPLMRDELDLDPASRIQGDREHRYEAVSLVASAFGVAADPVVSNLLKATASGWERNGEPVPVGVGRWLRVVDALPRFPDLPAREAARIVRCLARGFDTPVPEPLLQLEATSVEVDRRTSELRASADWPRFRSVDGGHGVLLDLREEPLANAYRLASGLFEASGRRIDWFVIAEHKAHVHHVSSDRARAERDRLERDRPPGLRVSTMFKGSGHPRATWRARKGIDLHYLAVRRPAPDAVQHWVDAHPYLIKGMWRDGLVVDRDRVARTADAIAAAMLDLLTTCGWSDADRGGWR